MDPEDRAFLAEGGAVSDARAHCRGEGEGSAMD
jgi:hypothetical protein